MPRRLPPPFAALAIVAAAAALVCPLVEAADRDAGGRLPHAVRRIVRATRVRLSRGIDVTLTVPGTRLVAPRAVRARDGALIVLANTDGERSILFRVNGTRVRRIAEWDAPTEKLVAGPGRYVSTVLRRPHGPSVALAAADGSDQFELPIDDPLPGDVERIGAVALDAAGGALHVAWVRDLVQLDIPEPGGGGLGHDWIRDEVVAHQSLAVESRSWGTVTETTPRITSPSCWGCSRRTQTVRVFALGAASAVVAHVNDRAYSVEHDQGRYMDLAFVEPDSPLRVSHVRWNRDIAGDGRTLSFARDVRGGARIAIQQRSGLGTWTETFGITGSEDYAYGLTALVDRLGRSPLEVSWDPFRVWRRRFGQVVVRASEEDRRTRVASVRTPRGISLNMFSDIRGRAVALEMARDDDVAALYGGPRRLRPASRALTVLDVDGGRRARRRLPARWGPVVDVATHAGHAVVAFAAETGSGLRQRTLRMPLRDR